MESREFGKLLTNNMQDWALDLMEKQSTVLMKPMKKRPEVNTQKFSHFTPRIRVKAGDSEVFAMALNKDATLLASSLTNGSLMINSTMLGDKLYTFKDDQMNFPITQLAWKPQLQDNYDGIQSFIGSCCDGSIIRWNSFKTDKVEHIQLNDKNQYSSVGYSYSGRRFVLAGLLPQIEVYDEDRMKLVYTLSKDKEKHSNKLFTCKFFYESENLLYSGGWDRHVKFWDVRGNKQTHDLFGPQICGDSIDMSKDGHSFVTGGGSGGEGVECWDLRNLSKGPVVRCPWETLKTGQVSNPLINVVKYLQGQNVIIAGGCDTKCPAKAFSSLTGELIDTFPKLNKACFALDIAKEKNHLVLGDAAGQLHFEHVNYTH